MTALTPRQYLIMLHDVLAAIAAILVTFVMRFDVAQMNAQALRVLGQALR